MKKTNKKLSFQREHVRSLSSDDLRIVAGGKMKQTWSCVDCPPTWDCTDVTCPP